FALENGAVERWVVVGESASLELARVSFARDRSEPTRFDANALHAADFLGAVDLHLSPLASVNLEAPEAANVALGGSAPSAFTQTFEDKRFTVTGVGAQTPIASFDVALASSVFNSGDALLFVVTGSAELSGQGLTLLVVDQAGQTQSYFPN
ncbi:MAG: hypothetical protein AAF658_18095, partial [Myxococcota bacterium]